MFSAHQLFTLRGIPIRVHGSLILFLVFLGLVFNVGAGLGGFLLTVLALGLVFTFVLLHELGHALVALHHGIGVRDITLYPLGGIASLTRMPENPAKEFQIAIAGPLVNVVLAAVFWLLGVLFPAAFLDHLLHANVALAVFNLLPAFPLDGGRILRAFLGTRMTYAAATRLAARTGQAIAVALGFLGLVNFHFMLVFIAVFIFLAAQAELMSVLLRSRPEARLFGEAFCSGGNDGRDARARRDPFSEIFSRGYRGTPRTASRQAGAAAGSGQIDQDRLVIEVLPDGTVRRYLR